MLQKIFGPMRDDVTWEGFFIMRCLMICTSLPIFVGDKVEKNEMSRSHSVHL